MLSSSSSGSEAGVRCREPGSLTGQNAEPVGMKLTLFLSGQEKSGTDADADCLELRGNTSSMSEGHTFSGSVSFQRECQAAFTSSPQKL